jgi:hypothetical protein
MRHGCPFISTLPLAAVGSGDEINPMLDVTEDTLLRKHANEDFWH